VVLHAHKEKTDFPYRVSYSNEFAGRGTGRNQIFGRLSTSENKAKGISKSKGSQTDV